MRADVRLGTGNADLGETLTKLLRPVARRRRATGIDAARLALEALGMAAGKGLLAGLAGTAAMSVASMLEMKVTGRGASTTPAQAAGKVLGVAPQGEDEKMRFATVVHWGYGTSLGAVRGVIALVGLEGIPAAIAHFAAVWGASLVLLPALGVSSPIWRWGPKQITLDAAEHVVYASATSAAYSFLSR